MKTKIFLLVGLFLYVGHSMQAQRPEIPVVTFEANAGRVFASDEAETLRLRLTFKTAGQVYIDWGDGNIIKMTTPYTSGAVIYGGMVKASGTVSTVKIYKEKGDGKTDQDNDLTRIEYRGESGNNGGITQFDASGAGDFLEYINLERNQLKTINVSENTNLKSLSVAYNQLTSIDLTNNPRIEKIYLRDNQLSSIDLTQNQLLTGVTLNGNAPFVDPCAYNALYEALPNLTSQGKTGNLVVTTSNPGVLTSKTSIVYNKGWTVTNSPVGDGTGCPFNVPTAAFTTSKSLGEEITLKLKSKTAGVIPVDWGNGLIDYHQEENDDEEEILQIVPLLK